MIGLMHAVMLIIGGPMHVEKYLMSGLIPEATFSTFIRIFAVSCLMGMLTEQTKNGKILKITIDAEGDAEKTADIVA